MQPKFELGQIVITQGAIAVVSHLTAIEIVTRHVTGDWGDMGAEDSATNEQALVHGGRLMSSYMVGKEKVWIITEWDRSVTTILLPDEY